MEGKFFFTVTNDLCYDQRMQRICSSLSANGFRIILVGRRLKNSPSLQAQPYLQKRLYCFFTKGKLFYIEYNFRLFFYLLFQKMDAICAIDLDTILPCLAISKIKKIKRVYDAHELFTELKEVQTSPFAKRVWHWIEKITVPQFKYGYTVSNSIAEEFKKRYGVHYEIIRNIARKKNLQKQIVSEKFFIYTGAVNEARGFEYLIPAMQYVNHTLVICGDGNFMAQAKELAKRYNVAEKIIFKGMLLPADLEAELSKAYIGINLVENTGLNQYYSLPNKFFDYIQLAVPQITMNFPEYKILNDKYDVAILINTLNVDEVAAAMNNLIDNIVLYERLKKNCLNARLTLIWENEENKLLEFYNSLFNN